jgi:hypothetical protein
LDGVGIEQKLDNEKFGKPAQAIMKALYEKDLLTPAPFYHREAA